MNHYLFGEGWIYVMFLYFFGGSLDLRYDSLFIWRGGWVYVMMHY